jgi:hypothetical protein
LLLSHGSGEECELGISGENKAFLGEDSCIPSFG